MKEITITLLVILCSLISLSYSQNAYSYSILNNGTCQSVQLDECVPCKPWPSSPTYYYKLYQSSYNNNISYSSWAYSDSACETEYGEAYINNEYCRELAAQCSFFIAPTSIQVLSLSLSSTDPIEVSLLGDEVVYSQIAANKLLVEGEVLNGVKVKSAGKNFFFERQVSETQYSSSVGVFRFGETYTQPPFTFTVTQPVVNVPNHLNSEIDRAIEDSSVIAFSNFFSTQITNNNVFSAYKLYAGLIYVIVDSKLDLDGLILRNPFYSMTNMTMFPPFHGNDFGLLVWQLEKSNTPFFTKECYNDEHPIGSNGALVEFYHCSPESISSFPALSFLSFSLDELGERKVAKPDEMSFSLF